MQLVNEMDLSILSLYVCIGFTALITAMVLCARSQDSVLSVSVRKERVVFSTTGFTMRGKPCPKTRESDALRREASRKYGTLGRIRIQAISTLTHGFTH